MLPKKKKPTPIKPGVARNLLTQKYLELPPVDDICYGHVLSLFYYSCGQSRATTAKKLLKLVPVSPALQESVLKKLNNAVKQVVTTSGTNKFRKLTDDKELAKFAAACSRKFTFPDIPVCANEPNPAPTLSPQSAAKTSDPSGSHFQAPLATSTPKKSRPFRSPIKTRHIARCSSCGSYR